MIEKAAAIDLRDPVPRLGSEEFLALWSANLLLADTLVQEGQETVDFVIPANHDDADELWNKFVEIVKPDPLPKISRIKYKSWYRQPNDNPTLPFAIICGGYKPRGSEGVPLPVTLVHTADKTPLGPVTSGIKMYLGVPEPVKQILQLQQ